MATKKSAGDILTARQFTNGFATYKRDYPTPVTNADLPTWPGLLGAIGTTVDDVAAAMVDDVALQRAVSAAKQWFCDFIQRYGAINPKSQTICIFLLKQADYGGYIDRPVNDNSQPIRIDVRFGGAGGAFK